MLQARQEVERGPLMCIHHMSLPWKGRARWLLLIFLDSDAAGGQLEHGNHRVESTIPFAGIPFAGGKPPPMLQRLCGAH